MASTGVLLPAGGFPCNTSAQNGDFPLAVSREYTHLFGAPVALKPVLAIEVSPQALILFQLITRLSQKIGFACVNALKTLAGMFKHKDRATRYVLAELIAAGWIQRKHTRPMPSLHCVDIPTPPGLESNRSTFDNLKQKRPRTHNPRALCADAANIG